MDQDMTRCSHVVVTALLLGFVLPAGEAGQPDPASPEAAPMRATDEAGRPEGKKDWERIAEFLENGQYDQAIALWKESFERTEEKRDRQVIAARLVTHGVKDAEYFDYLAGYAREAIQSDMPCLVNFDDKGRTLRGQTNEAFLAWCTEHRLAAEECFQRQSDFTQDVMKLANTGDPRAFDLLAQAMRSPNCMIVASAAHGLALIGDKRAIGPLQQAAERFPGEVAYVVAKALVYFDDPEAQAIARRVVSGEIFARRRTDEEVFQSIRELALKEKEQRRNSAALPGGRQ